VGPQAVPAPRRRGWKCAPSFVGRAAHLTPSCACAVVRRGEPGREEADPHQDQQVSEELWGSQPDLEHRSCEERTGKSLALSLALHIVMTLAVVLRIHTQNCRGSTAVLLDPFNHAPKPPQRVSTSATNTPRAPRAKPFLLPAGVDQQMHLLARPRRAAAARLRRESVPNRRAVGSRHRAVAERSRHLQIWLQRQWRLAGAGRPLHTGAPARAACSSDNSIPTATPGSARTCNICVI